MTIQFKLHDLTDRESQGFQGGGQQAYVEVYAEKPDVELEAPCNGYAGQSTQVVGGFAAAVANGFNGQAPSGQHAEGYCE